MSGIDENRFTNLKKQQEIARARNEAIKKGLNEKDNNPVNDKNSNEGTTTRTTVDVTEMMQEVSDEVRHGEKETVVNSINEKGQVVNSDNKYADNVNYNNSEVKIYDFLEYMTEGKDFSENEMAELLINFVQEILLNPKYGSANISAVTQIIDIRLNKLSSVLSMELLTLTQTVVDALLAQDVSVASTATFGDIKGIVNGMIDAIIAKRPPVEPDPVEPPVNPDPDPVEPDPVDPLEELFNQNKFSNNLFTKAYIDTIRDEFCLGEEETVKICGKLNTIISTMVDEIGKENIDFETAKQIVYNAMYGRWPLKSEVADVIKNTPNGASLNDAEIMEIVNSLSADIYKACNSAYINQTGDKTLLTAQEKLDIITQVLQTKRPDLYGVQEPDTVVIDTPEQALEVLQAKFAEYNNAHYTFPAVYSDKIADFLLGFQEDASLYLQLRGIDKDFADFLVTALAKAVQDINAPQSGNPQIRELSKVEAKFIEFLQNIESIIPTSNKLMSKDSNGNDVQIKRVEAANNEYGYQFVLVDDTVIGANDITYNEDGSFNQGMLLKTMLDYLRETVYDGQLNESQLGLLYKNLFNSVIGLSADGRLLLNLNNEVNRYDQNDNGTYLDDIFIKMMEISNTYQSINIDEITNDEIDINDLFGGKANISASYINNKENVYLLSNNPATRLIMGELVNVSNKYNITPDNNSLDLYNVFIRMINDMCGVENTNPPTLSKTTLQKYLNEHSIQDLKNLINSTELRNAYYESTFKIDGEIEGFYRGKSEDSWLLSGLMTLNSSPEGQQIIHNAIKSYVGPDGKTYYSVTFYAGYSEPVGTLQLQSIVQRTETYTFSQDELYDLMATGMYSKLYQSEDGTCSWEVLLFEAATSRLRREQLVKNPYKNHSEDNKGDIDIYKGTPDEFITYLTGNLYTHSIGSLGYDSGFSLNVYDNLAARGLVDEDGRVHNNTLFFLTRTDNHCYAVTRITADRVYFIDPNDSTKEYYTTWESFRMGYVTYYDSETDRQVDTLHFVSSCYFGELDESPALQSPVEPPVEPDVHVNSDPDPVVINTPEDALEVLQAKMSEVANGVLKVEDIEEYLAQFKSEASLYIQMKFGYDEGYADLLAMFIANATREAFKSKTKINSIDVGLKFCTLLQNQDFSFLDTSNDRFMGAIQRSLNIIDENWITRIEVARTSDGYKLYGGEWINNDNDLVYNQDGSINQGVFFTFMTDYLRDTVFGGTLNESELKVLYEKILKKFAGSNYKDGKVALNPNSNNTTNYVNGKYDKDHDGSWFNDFFRAMMEVASEVNVINLDEIKDEDVNLDALFGGKSSISTSDIHKDEKTYLLSNDPTVRLIFGELINASDEYNITTNADYYDFLNIFVQMINNEVDVADTLDNSGNQILTREALEKYLEKHSIQELKDFIQGTELRNAYFESTFKINGEIEGFYQALSGDCWLLSGLMALNASPEGKEIIKHAISSYVGEDGQTYYTVTFQGGYNKYGSWTQEIITSTFSQAELFDLMATGKYSKIQKSEDGTFDWDLFLFEAAVADLREKQKMNTYLGFAQFFGTDGDPYLFMGSQDELISYLTGIDLGYRPGAERKADTTYYGVTKEYRQGLHQLVNDLMAQGLIDPVDGTIHNYAFYFSKDGHALAITRIIGDKIYFIDPNDSTKEYYTTWSSFESGTITYYDAKTGTKAGTLTIKEAGFAGPLDETPVWQALQEQE